jgi:hypothetical protein
MPLGQNARQTVVPPRRDMMMLMMLLMLMTTGLMPIKYLQLHCHSLHHPRPYHTTIHPSATALATSSTSPLSALILVAPPALPLVDLHCHVLLVSPCRFCSLAAPRTNANLSSIANWSNATICLSSRASQCLSNGAEAAIKSRGTLRPLLSTVSDQSCGHRLRLQSKQRSNPKRPKRFRFLLDKYVSMLCSSCSREVLVVWC